MFSIDLIIIIISCAQPLIISFLITLSFSNYLYSSLFYRYYNNIRNKQVTTKFYECSTYSRLSYKYLYNFYTMSLCVMFLIYDVDIIFFVPEVNSFWNYDYSSLLIMLVLIFFFFIGLIIDYKVITFNWRL